MALAGWGAYLGLLDLVLQPYRATQDGETCKLGKDYAAPTGFVCGCINAVMRINTTVRFVVGFGRVQWEPMESMDELHLFRLATTLVTEFTYSSNLGKRGLRLFATRFKGSRDQGCVFMHSMHTGRPRRPPLGHRPT